MIRLIIILFLLASCGENEEQKFIIQGEEKSCTVIETTDCGLTLACEGEGMVYCVSN
jgi:hypothetical protein